MGRNRKTEKQLPPRVYLRRGAYYFVRPGDERWIRLGTTEPDAFRALAKIKEEGAATLTLSDIFGRYARDILPNKAAKTISEQTRQLAKLDAVFGSMDPRHLRPTHIATYLDQSAAKIAANREIALLSSVMKSAIRWGHLDTNPCTGVAKNKEKPRQRYITDAEFLAVLHAASPILRAAMMLAYLTGQRIGDLLALRAEQIQPDGIHIKQAKTGARLIIAWSDALHAAIDAAKTAHGNIASLYILATAQGQRYTYDGFASLWQRHITHCLESGILAERFSFHDLRAKARSDGSDPKLLGHANPAAMARIYARKPIEVTPVK